VQLNSKREGGVHWKKAREHDPWPIKYYFSNNFMNPAGITGIAGIFFSPAFLFASHAYPETMAGLRYLGWWLYAGRLLSTCIELHFIASYLDMLAEKSD
jgi:hypothetical protein